jgi:thiamine biosynthesis lipoprotein
MIEPKKEILRYQHRAMATLFELMIADEDDAFAAGAVHAAFEEIDRLELDLSRYLPNSDVSRINNLQPDQSVRVSADTFECLRLGLQYYEETGGTFDVATGALKDCWVGRDRSLLAPSAEEIERARTRSGMCRLELDERHMTIHVRGPAPLLDLGAIGKGFAVDRAAELLREWGVGSAFVHGGTSSAYAFGDYPGHAGWPVTLSNPAQPSEVLEKVRLKDQGLGGSGITQGRHIIDPRTAAPVESRRASWVLSQSAARSDALSTACMIMTQQEIAGLVEGSRELRAIIVEEHPPAVLRFGRWGAV